ncbi:hypothetical protein SD70_26410 [Gordoniibacillus kamchatkensis]|uniref:LacI family transcriptional regulator n=1 Tax=Gordoniibacillus kamchatkensis TaxID=1590651 RepID=A0ABR5ABN4_9BACL|nr:LacI family DNA-binding transcriptional regulator [Paenibacillus sp. VKM B-2647]KIL38446.1 hypothetical protein SD70_26410 [Paenibacillus sp. VKM B-2647]
MTKLTIKDIAKEAGVSTATISRVLNNSGYVSNDIKQHVMEVIRKLNYQPNAIARSLKQEKSRSVGIVLPDMTNPYFMNIARAIQHRCFQEGYHLLFVDTEENPDKEKEALDFLTEKRIEALILAGTGGNREQIQAISGAGIRVILVDRRYSNLKLDTVAEDNIYASKAAIEYLIEKNHRRIGIIGGPQSISTARERRQGAMIGLEEAGIALAPELMVEGDYTRDSGTDALRRLMALPEPPTAIFSANNEMTFGVYLGMQQLGLPLDSIEVVSFGNLEFSSLFRHKLSVIMQNPHDIGEIVGDLLIRRLGGDDSETENQVLVPKLVPYEA